MTTTHKPRLTVADGYATTTSLVLAEHFCMRHDNVLRNIDSAIRVNAEEFNRLNFEAVEYVDTKGEGRRMYRLTKDALCFVVLGLTGKKAGHWKAAYIEAFDAMARTLRRRDSSVERRRDAAVDFGLHVCQATQEAEDQLRLLLDEALELAQALLSRGRIVSADEEQGLALLLTGLRVPDALLYVLLARRSNPVPGQAAQWVLSTYEALARELDHTTPARVRDALDRLRTLGLVERRPAPGHARSLEYRVDITRAHALVIRLRADPGNQLAVRTALKNPRCSPLERLLVPLRPQPAGATSEDAYAFINRWLRLQGELVQRKLDPPGPRIEAYLQQSLEPGAQPQDGAGGAPDAGEAVPPELPVLRVQQAAADELGCPRLLLIDGQPVATSLALASHFDKRHDNVLRNIRRAAEDAPSHFAQINFLPSQFIDGKGERRAMYYLTANGFRFVAMGFTGTEAARWKSAYIAAFNRMQAELYCRELEAREGLLQAVELTRIAVALRLRINDVMLPVVTHALRMMRALSPVDDVTGIEELGLALRLSALRVPDAAVYVELLRQCNPKPYMSEPAQWLAKSFRSLAADLAGSTAGRVRGSLRRLQVLGLLECRPAQRGRQLEYRVDPRQLPDRLDPLCSEVPAQATLRATLAQAVDSPLTPVIDTLYADAARDAAAAEHRAEFQTSLVHWRALRDELAERAARPVLPDVAHQLQQLLPELTQPPALKEHAA